MRTWAGIAFSIAFVLAGVNTLRADDLAFNGYIDTRLVVPPGEESWLKGGLGKLRFGSAESPLTGRFVEAVGEVNWLVTTGLEAVATARVEPDERTGVDALEAYASYSRPFNDDWSASLQAGAFFPPVSLENQDLGWTSPYTLTPSAINSWVGDELRIIGSQALVSWHTDTEQVTVLAALFCCNEPAGDLMAERGWSMDDRPTGLFEEPHEPNASLALLGHDFPDRFPLFSQFDHHVGWYAGAAWDIKDVAHAQFLRYDNDADPAAHREDYFAWHTEFWSAGISTHLSGMALLFQGLLGSTRSTVQSTSSAISTRFWSSYALASYDFDDWRISVRGDLFETGDDNDTLGQEFAEHGRAVTAALIWTPRAWLRLAGEFVTLNAVRNERIQAGLGKNETDNQFQLSARAFF